MKSTRQKKFYRKIAPLVKSMFKILVRSLRGWKYTSICISWGHPPRNSIKPEGHWVTSRMAVYLEAGVGAMKQNAFFPTELPKPLLWGQPAKFSPALLALPAVCLQLSRLRSGSDLGLLLSQPRCSFLPCLQLSSPIYSFSQSTLRNEGYGPSPPSQPPPPFPLLQNK